MNRLLIALSSLFLMYVGFGFYLSQYQFNFFEKDLKKSDLFFNYKIHSNIYSDISIGSGTYTSIVEESKQAKSKFILFTDLNPVTDLPHDRYVMNVGELFGAKIMTDEFSYTAYSAKSKNRTDYENRALEVGDSPEFLVINHLDAEKKPLHAFDGIDAINLKNMSYKVWDQKQFSTIWSLIFYPFNPRLALMRLYRDPADELAIFDALSRSRKTNLFLATEATAKAVPVTNWLLKFPSYENVLGMASQRLLTTSELTNNIEKDKKAVFDLLKAGSFYVSMDTLGDSTGFESYIFSDRKKVYVFMGDATDYDHSLALYFRLPKEPSVYHEVVLYRNGTRLDHMNTSSGSFTLPGAGVYRLQVRLNTNLPFPDSNKWLTWIFTNNFYVR